MPSWLTSLLFAVLVVTIPFSLLLKIMLQLPKPLALSHRRWPVFLIIALIGAITAYLTIFIRSAYYGGGYEPLAVLMQFVIAALAYIFGLVLLLRQFTGVYPEFIVTTGSSGLLIRKTMYRNIRDVEQVSSKHGETRLLVETTHGHVLSFTLPTREVSIFYERLRLQR
jgi:hypothetical protein